jgi:hypothetical protein
MAGGELYPKIVLPSSMRLETGDSQPLCELSPATIATLAVMAVRNRTSYITMIMQAVANEHFRMREEAAGARFILQRGEELNYLVYAPAPPC